MENLEAAVETVKSKQRPDDQRNLCSRKTRGREVSFKNIQGSEKLDIKAVLTGCATTADGTSKSYTVQADNGATYQRNSSHIHHLALPQ